MRFSAQSVYHDIKFELINWLCPATYLLTKGWRPCVSAGLLIHWLSGLHPGGVRRAVYKKTDLVESNAVVYGCGDLPEWGEAPPETPGLREVVDRMIHTTQTKEQIRDHVEDAKNTPGVDASSSDSAANVENDSEKDQKRIGQHESNYATDV